MNKEDLVQAFRTHSDCSKDDAKDAVDWFLNTITEQTGASPLKLKFIIFNLFPGRHQHEHLQ